MPPVPDRWSCVFAVFVSLALNMRAGSSLPVLSASAELDPVCRPTNGIAVSPSPWPQPESTRRIIQRLADIRKALDPVQVSFLSEERAQLLKTKLEQSTNAGQSF